MRSNEHNDWGKFVGTTDERMMALSAAMPDVAKAFGRLTGAATAEGILCMKT